MRVLALVLVCLGLAAPGCRQGGPAGPGLDRGVAGGGVHASRVSGGIRVANGTDRPVAYAVWNRGWLALFAPCADPGPGCVRLSAGAAVVVPPGEIGGYAPGAPEAIVRWWRVVPDGAGGHRAGEVHEIVVPL